MGGPLPAVETADLKQVWTVLASKRASNTSRDGRAIDQRLLRQYCSPGCNVVAAFVRASLVDALLQQGLLNEWRVEDGLQNRVFEVAADFPFEGVATDSEAFLSVDLGLVALLELEFLSELLKLKQ